MRGVWFLGVLYMRKYLYALEDHFCALSEEMAGTIAGHLSGGASKLFAVLGDVLQVGLDPNKP